MPKIVMERQPSRIVPFPAWGEGMVGQVGGVGYALLEDNQVVSRRYRVTRPATLHTSQGIYDVTVSGSGGHYTKPAFRRKGYNALLDQQFLKDSQREGTDLAMLFCLEHLVQYNVALGWTMIAPEAMAVTFQQPSGVVACPSHIWAGVQMLNGIQGTVLAIDLMGFPW